MTSESELLLTCGSTWIDDAIPVMRDLSITGRVGFGFGGGEMVSIDAIRDRRGVCIANVAVLPWGVTINVGHSFYTTTKRWGIRDVFLAISRHLAQGDDVAGLKDSLALTETRFQAIVQAGIDARNQLLINAGWRVVDDTEGQKLVAELDLVFLPTISADEAFPHAVANGEIYCIDTPKMRDSFNTDRSLYWWLENGIRSSVMDALDQHGNSCPRLIIFDVHHGTFVAQRPTAGWRSLAIRAWPIDFVLGSGFIFVVAPEIEEGVLLYSFEPWLIGCGREISSRLEAWFCSRHAEGSPISTSSSLMRADHS